MQFVLVWLFGVFLEDWFYCGEEVVVVYVVVLMYGNGIIVVVFEYVQGNVVGFYVVVFDGKLGVQVFVVDQCEDFLQVGGVMFGGD